MFFILAQEKNKKAQMDFIADLRPNFTSMLKHLQSTNSWLKGEIKKGNKIVGKDIYRIASFIIYCDKFLIRISIYRLDKCYLMVLNKNKTDSFIRNVCDFKRQ